MNIILCIGNTLAIFKIIRESFNLCVSIHEKIKNIDVNFNLTKQRFKNDKNELINYITKIK